MILILIAMVVVVFGLSVWFWLFAEASAAKLCHMKEEASRILSENSKLESENVAIHQDLLKLQKDLEDVSFSRDDNLTRSLELEAEVRRKQDRIESLNSHISGLEAKLESEDQAHRQTRETLQAKSIWAARPTCREAITTITTKNKSETAFWVEFRRAENNTLEYLRLPHSRFKDGQASALANWADNPFPTCKKDGK